LIAGGGTGGHLMPALAIAQAVRTLAPAVEPVLVGSERGVEARLLPTRDFRFHLLPSEPIYRRAWWKNLRLPLTTLKVLRRLDDILSQEAPEAVLGTGGYASAPVVWLAARRGIPTAIQEQNAYPGLATRWLAPRVRQIFLGLPEARDRLRPGARTEVFVTGNPITPPDPSRRPAARERFGLPPETPVVLITGGSQGALAINQAVADWLERGGAQGLVVLWATGAGSYARFASYHRPPAVQVTEFLDPIADAYAVADLVVARAGMMTGAELCAWGLASILIPLPSAAADHQTLNARALEAAGASRLLPQRNLSPERLGGLILELIGNRGERERMAQAALARGKPGASREIAARFVSLFDPAALSQLLK
jgi:UDP-N-acetylglucosamine--N-acetylmuramyl-(pentapeptide) pyrophosphoryl-undecaprenol N-acetylglucosamine transferase